MDAARTRGIKRVLIYRLGSLGDTIVALPSFHLIAGAFPEAERRVLTNLPVASQANPMEAILGNSGLVHGFISYPLQLRNWQKILKLSSQIREWSPEVLVYLAEPRGTLKLIRDAGFFKLSGIESLVGVPYSKKQQENYWINEELGFEYEGARLLRCLSSLGEIDLDDPKSWIWS